MPRPSIIDLLRDQIEHEGYQPGTQAYEQRLLALRVAKCQELRGYVCGVCPFQEQCEMYRTFLVIRSNANGT